MAAASNVQQFLEHLDEKVLECPLCYERLKDLKTLPCLHTYCLPCLTKWVNEKDRLQCPNCRQFYDIPNGGLNKLPPNTFINNLLESIEQFQNADKMKCYCGKNTANFYCQECMQYICTACKHTHETLLSMVNHKLHTIKDIKLMTITQFSALRPPLCPVHKKELEFYCSICKVPVCVNCTIAVHKVTDGKHLIISISEAYGQFKDNVNNLKKSANAYKQKLQAALTKVQCKTNKLRQCRDACRTDINNFVEEMIKMITEKGEELNKDLDEVYNRKKRITDTQTDELNTIMQNFDTKWNFIAQLLKSNKATALQSSHTIAALQETIQQLPDTEPNDNGEMYVYLNKEYNAKSLKEKTLGFITETQEFECEIDYQPHDVVKTDDGCLLVSDLSNKIHRYKQSGEYVSTLTLPSNLEVRSMYKMKQNDMIVFTDDGNKCITICKSDGHVVKSIGKGILKNPYGIDVDEQLNVVYVADCHEDCVFMFNMDSDQMNRRIGSEGNREGELYGPKDVVISNEGHLIVADWLNHRLQLFDKEGKFIKVLVGEGGQDGKVEYPRAVIIDKDNNMLIASEHKLQLFNSEGHFIKRIDQEKDGLNEPKGLSIFSYNPRRVGVANYGGNNIKIFNY